MDQNMPRNIERAKYVRGQREERGWSQAQLAKVADLSMRTIQRIEKDGSASFETMMALAQAFDIDVKLLTTITKGSKPSETQKRIYLMPRVLTGKDLANLVVGTDQFQFEHDDDNDQRSIRAMKDILTILKQDVIRLYDAADPVKRLEVEEELSNELSGLESYGYYLFGIRRVIPKIKSDQRNLVSMATLYMSHSRSQKVVKDKAYMVLPALLPEVTR